jgi:hypothetical protein
MIQTLAVCVMRERTPLTREILQQLPNLKLIASTGPRNASIDSQTATGRNQGLNRHFVGGGRPVGDEEDVIAPGRKADPARRYLCRVAAPGVLWPVFAPARSSRVRGAGVGVAGGFHMPRN